MYLSRADAHLLLALHRLQQHPARAGEPGHEQTLAAEKGLSHAADLADVVVDRIGERSEMARADRQRLARRKTAIVETNCANSPKISYCTRYAAAVASISTRRSGCASRVTPSKQPAGLTARGPSRAAMTCLAPANASMSVT